MHRLLTSPHYTTFWGYVAITLGIFVTGCAIVGLAVVLSLIGEAVR